jgi:uncharacterized protein YndB with AHSA1/START domain
MRDLPHDAAAPRRDPQSVLIKRFHGRVAALIDADPDRVYSVITDIRQLPRWNRRITEVVQAPMPPLADGAEWTVRLVAPPGRWVSRARVLTYDPAARVFRHRSSTDDGNPTYVDWTWTVTPNGPDSQVAVEWQAEVKTFWRQALFARLRRAQLTGEVLASLDALAYHAASRDSARAKPSREA